MASLNSYWAAAISKLTLIKTANDIDSLKQKLSDASNPTVLGFLNAHGFNSLLDTPLFFDSIKCMDVVLRDGIGLKLLLQMLGKESGENMNGTDFIPTLLRQYNGKRVAIIATKEPYLSKTKEILENEYGINVVITEDGFQPDDYYLTQLLDTPVDVVLLGMGMPKQEKIACELKSKLSYPTLIICGGAIVDFLAGRFNRAPLWVRQFGMEWLYRLSHEPRRLFKRYIYGNTIFVIRSFRYKMNARKK